MPNTFHLRFTPAPRSLPPINDYDISGALARATRYIVAYETKDKTNKDTIPHYHVWIETGVCEKTLRTQIVQALKIPTLTRGKTNGYYMVQLWSDPGYICKQGCVQSSKGYSPAEIEEFAKTGKEKFMRDKVDIVEVAAEGRAKKPDDMLDVYQKYLVDVIPENLAHIGQTYTIGHLRSASITWWRKRSGGLLPQTSTYKRFLASAWLEVHDILRKSQQLAEVELEKYGY